MSLTGALFRGVSGLTSNGDAMNIIGDNIANVNTVGFKAGRAVFFDLLSATTGKTQIGSGSRLAAADRIFAQGGLETTNSSTDMAVQGSGFFALKDDQGGEFFTRAGQFSVAKDGALVNPGGLVAQGIQLDTNGNPTSGLSNIVLDSTILSPPVGTTSISLAANLDATVTTPTTAFPADGLGTEDSPANWFAASNFSTVVSVIDSLGQSHDLTFLFRKTGGANEWDYRAVANSSEVSTGTAGQLFQVGLEGTLAFGTDGTLDPGSSTVNSIGPIGWINGSSNQTIAAADLIFTGTTQFALRSSVNSLSQDGSPSGTLTEINIDSEGVITGIFSSGHSEKLYQLALADFANPGGLNHVGNSLFARSPDSGEVVFGNASAGGFGSVLSGTLELSTVDLASEFVKMVTTQRGFQGSSRTITVADGLFDEVLNLKR